MTKRGFFREQKRKAQQEATQKQETKEKAEVKEKKYSWWDIAIVSLLALYLILTVSIFIVHQKISRLKNSISKQQSAKSSKINNTPSLTPRPEPTLEQKEERLKEKLAEYKENIEVIETAKVTEVQSKLADVYYQQGKVSKAIEQQEEIVEKKPTEHKSHLHLGLMHMSSKNYQQAIDHLENALSNNHPKRKIIEMWLTTLRKKQNKENSK